MQSLLIFNELGNFNSQKMNSLLIEEKALILSG